MTSVERDLESIWRDDGIDRHGSMSDAPGLDRKGSPRELLRLVRRGGLPRLYPFALFLAGVLLGSML
jgi:hypothetical protein